MTALATFAVPVITGCTEPVVPIGETSPPGSLSHPAFAQSVGTGVTMTDLGTLSYQSYAKDINDAGVVVGWSESKSYQDAAWAWTPTSARATTGTLWALPTLGGCCSSAIAVNSLQIAGAATDAAGVSHDVFWTISGAISERLTTNAVACAPLDMNDGGQLAGSAYVGGVHYACIWTPDAPNGSTGSTRVLPLPAGASSAIGHGLNSRGDVVGQITLTISGDQHAYVWWSDGTTLDLGTLPGGRFALAKDLNDSGEIVGDSYEAISGQQWWRAFVWTAQGGLRDLGAIGPSSYAYDINNVVNGVSQVVGETDVSSKAMDYDAALWTITHDGSGAVTGVTLRDLGRPKASLRAEAYALSSNIGGVVQAAGVSVSTSLVNKGTLWTVR